MEFEEQEQQRQEDGAERVCSALNRMAGMIHATNCTRAIWSQQAGNPQLAAAVQYGHQLAFTGLVITMRKFEDLFEHHLAKLLPEDSQAKGLAREILADCRRRHIRQTANKLIAHYAADKEDVPLSHQEIGALIRSNGWTYEDEITEWGDWAMKGIIKIRDHLARGGSHGTTQ